VHQDRIISLFVAIQSRLIYQFLRHSMLSFRLFNSLTYFLLVLEFLLRLEPCDLCCINLDVTTNNMSKSVGYLWLHPLAPASHLKYLWALMAIGLDECMLVQLFELGLARRSSRGHSDGGFFWLDAGFCLWQGEA
jgi:hypothetical protein